MRRQGALQGVGMTEVMRLLGKTKFGIAPVQRKSPAGEGKKAGERPKQTGLAGPVGSENRQRFPGRHR